MQKIKSVLVLLAIFCFIQNGMSEKYVVGSGKATDDKKAPVTEQKSTANDTLIVSARLVEIPGTFAPNDLYNYVYVMKYRVVKVEKGKYTAKDLLVGQYNPLIPRKKITDAMDPVVDGDVVKFEVGAVHRLVLITPIEKFWNDAVEDEYYDSELTKYFACKTDIVK